MAATKLDLKVEELEFNKDMTKLPMIAKYDEALKQLLSQVFAGSVILAPAERAFEMFINQQKDSLKFPFISLFPVQGYTRVTKNFAAENIGRPINRLATVYDDNTLERKGVTPNTQNFYQFMYFDIPYTITCWSTKRSQALQLVQELLFWLRAQGQVKVRYKDQTFYANAVINDNIQDTSAYTQYADLGNIYKFDIVLTIQAPVFRTANYLNISHVDLTLDLKED